MYEEKDPSLAAFKQSIRECARANRQAQAGKPQLSRIICQALADLPEYSAARTILFYVDVRAEVRTRDFLPDALAQGKQVAVPFCRDGRLELFRLASLSELATGSYQILEPRPDLRNEPKKRIDIGQIDLVVVPGVAFDREGSRLGHGQGFYDKLLATARRQTSRVALAFECQLFPTMPTAEHDVRMDVIVTERAVYRVGQPPAPLAAR